MVYFSEGIRIKHKTAQTTWHNTPGVFVRGSLGVQYSYAKWMTLLNDIEKVLYWVKYNYCCWHKDPFTLYPAHGPNSETPLLNTPYKDSKHYTMGHKNVPLYLGHDCGVTLANYILQNQFCSTGNRLY